MEVDEDRRNTQFSPTTQSSQHRAGSLASSSEPEEHVIDVLSLHTSVHHGVIVVTCGCNIRRNQRACKNPKARSVGVYSCLSSNVVCCKKKMTSLGWTPGFRYLTEIKIFCVPRCPDQL